MVGEGTNTVTIKKVQFLETFFFGYRNRELKLTAIAMVTKGNEGDRLFSSILGILRGCYFIFNFATSGASWQDPAYVNAAFS